MEEEDWGFSSARRRGEGEQEVASARGGMLATQQCPWLPEEEDEVAPLGWARWAFAPGAR